MKILIEFIPHYKQRYETPADWQYTKEGDLNIRVSQIGGLRSGIFEHLLAIHELVEAITCTFAGISDRKIDEWDFGKEWMSGGYSEPGEDPRAPYHRQHILAELIERQIVHFLVIDWEPYGAAINALPSR